MSRTPSKKPNFPAWTGDLTHELDQMAVWNHGGHMFFGRLDFEALVRSVIREGENAVRHLLPAKRLKAIVPIDPVVRPRMARRFRRSS